VVEINNNLQVNTLEAWQGSFGTGSGYMPVPRRKKNEGEEADQEKGKEGKGLTKGDDGRVHVDIEV
jgi:hypothetical protein